MGQIVRGGDKARVREMVQQGTVRKNRAKTRRQRKGAGINIRPRTSQHCLSHALFGHISLLPPIFGERSLEHEATQFVSTFELRRSVQDGLLCEVRLYVGDLNVGVVHIQRTRINLK